MESARYTYPTTDIARSIFGDNITSQEARKIWETSSTETQCTNSKGAGAFINDITTCYICGMKIKYSGVANDGRNPECEHILPILQAVIYLGLYSHKETMRESARTIQEFQSSPTTIQNPFYNPELVDLEYAWSHRACNQIKSDNIYMDISDEKFSVDIHGLEGLLREIWDTKITGYKDFKADLHKKYKTPEKFIRARTSDGSKLISRFNDIVERLNRSKAPYITLLAGVATMVDGTMSNNAYTQIMDPKDRSIAAKKKYDDNIDKIIQNYKLITTNVNNLNISKKEEYKKHIVDNMDEYIKIKLIMDFNGMPIKAWEQGVKDMCNEIIQKRQDKRATKRKRYTNTEEDDYRTQFKIAQNILKHPNNNTINLIRGPSLTPIIPNNNNRALLAYNMLVDIHSKRQKPNGGTRKRTHRRTRKRKL